jgi:predicted RNA-binding protein
MANYILTTTDAHHIAFERKKVDAFSIANTRLDKMKWPIYRRTSNKENIIPGDFCLIYIGGSKNLSKNIIAFSTVDQVIDDNTPVDNLDILTDYPEKILSFKNIYRFEKPVSFKKLLNDLEFVSKNRKYWGVFLQGGCKKICDHDFNLILNSTNSLIRSF